MKKTAIILAFTVLPYLSFAQSSFDKYENMKDVSSVVVTSKMFKLLSKLDLQGDDTDVKDYMDLVENIENIKVFATENKGVAQKMKVDVASYLKATSMEELMRVNQDGKNVKFYSKPGKDDNHVRELFMFLDDGKQEAGVPNTVVLTITGDIDLRQVSKIAEHLNVPGGEELKKVKKPN